MELYLLVGKYEKAKDENRYSSHQTSQQTLQKILVTNLFMVVYKQGFALFFKNPTEMDAWLTLVLISKKILVIKHYNLFWTSDSSPSRQSRKFLKEVGFLGKIESITA